MTADQQARVPLSALRRCTRAVPGPADRALLGRSDRARPRPGARAVLGLVLLLAGCATPSGSAGAPDGPSTDAAPPTPAPVFTGPADPPADTTGWTLSVADVTDVLPGEGSSRLLLRTVIAAVAPHCADQPEITRSTWENGMFYATVAAPVSNATEEFGGPCSEGAATGEVLVDLGRSPDGAVLVLNEQTWEPGPGGTYQRCDEFQGCGEPPADPCEGYTGRFIARIDAPRGASKGIESCDGTWMIFRVDPSSGLCGPQDGEPTCDVPSDRRYAVLWFDASVPAWVERDWITERRSCDDVLAALPDLPAAMCRDLVVP
jgi:hypothetical protein